MVINSISVDTTADPTLVYGLTPGVKFLPYVLGGRGDGGGSGRGEGGPFGLVPVALDDPLSIEKVRHESMPRAAR